MKNSFWEFVEIYDKNRRNPFGLVTAAILIQQKTFKLFRCLLLTLFAVAVNVKTVSCNGKTCLFFYGVLVTA